MCAKFGADDDQSVLNKRTMSEYIAIMTLFVISLCVTV